MSSDINNHLNNTEIYTPQKQSTKKIEPSAIEKTLKNIVSPVFDFFTKEEQKTDEVVLKDYSNEISHYELKAAETQRILNDADPKSRSKLNIVI